MIKNTVYSIGHSTHSIDVFANLLNKCEISALADVRSVPWSRYQTHFNKDELKSSLRDYGMDYRFYGKALGGRPDKPSLFNGLVANYEAMSQVESFKQGIKLIIEGSKKHKLVMMCSEHDPIDCHRCLLVGRALSEADINVKHILANGEITSQDVIEDQLLIMNNSFCDDLYAPREELLDLAYKARSMKVAYRDTIEANENVSELSNA